MKNKLLLIGFLCLAALMGCEEIPPKITLNQGGGGGGNTPVEDQQRQVLIEEFTGVRCVNCPAGTEAIQVLLNTYGEQLVPVSIHAGFFAPPYNNSLYDFRTTEGNNILSYVGEPLGFPTAVVNRKLFAGEQDLQLGQGQWPGFIFDEVAIEPLVKIAINPDYNSATRKLEVNIKLFVQENISDTDVRLTVLITEDDIVDVQLTPDGIKTDYHHKHVLRGTITNYDGAPLNGPLNADQELTRNYSFTLPDAWVADNCHLVAFVHYGGSSKEVLQAHSVEVTE